LQLSATHPKYRFTETDNVGNGGERDGRSSESGTETSGDAAVGCAEGQRGQFVLSLCSLTICDLKGYVGGLGAIGVWIVCISTM